MDDFQQRAIRNLTQRHENQIRQLAESIAEEIGYLIARLNADASSAGHYARSIATDAQEIVTRIAALEAVGDAVGILKTSDEPAKEGRPVGVGIGALDRFFQSAPQVVVHADAPEWRAVWCHGFSRHGRGVCHVVSSHDG